MTPYWTEHGEFAAQHNVKVAIEMHPGFVVYSPETMLGCARSPAPRRMQLRSQPHVLARHRPDRRHPRTWRLNLSRPRQRYPALSGKFASYRRLDTKPYTDERNRAWIFRTCGYGHGEEWWREFVSTLRMFGYDDVLSIEHEDSLHVLRRRIDQSSAIPPRTGHRTTAQCALVGIIASAHKFCFLQHF